MGCIDAAGFLQFGLVCWLVVVLDVALVLRRLCVCVLFEGLLW